jgi:WD40 repeat protein
MQFGESSQFGTHENDIERTTVLMFGIGTGLAAAEIKSVFEVSTMQFSENGKYLSLGSYKGSVCIWQLGNTLFQTVKQMIDSMKIQPDFWYNYPIFLPDY